MSETLIADFVADESASFSTGPAITCTRALGTATRVNSSGLMELVSADTAIVDYDPLTLACKGVWSGEARTNICLQSALASGWGGIHDATLDSAASTGPFGTATMSRLNVSTTTADHSINSAQITTTPGSNYFTAMFFKDDGVRYAGYSFVDTADHYITVLADLQMGTIAATDVGASSGTIVETGIEDWGDGLYRVWMIGSTNDTPGTSFFWAYTSDSASPTFTNVGLVSHLGVEGEDVFLSHADVHLGDVWAHHIPTTTVPVTRNADNIQAVVTDETSDDGYGAWYIHGSVNAGYSRGGTKDPTCVSVSHAGGSATGLLMNLNRAVETFWTRVLAGPSTVNLIGSGIVPANNEVRAAIGFALNDAILFVDGTEQGSDITSGPYDYGDSTILYIGSYQGTSNWWNGHIKAIRHDNETKTHEELEAWSNGVLSSASLADIRTPWGGLPLPSSDVLTFITDSGVTGGRGLNNDFRDALCVVAGLTEEQALNYSIQDAWKLYIESL